MNQVNLASREQILDTQAALQFFSLPSRGAAILVDLKPMADGHLRSL
jgi:hypothetical protein